MLKKFKNLIRPFLIILSLFLVAVCVSSVFGSDNNVHLLALIGFQLTVAGIGAALSLLTVFLFAWISKKIKKGEIFTATSDSFGFGLLPGIVVWKVFEQNTFLGKGNPVFEPLPLFSFLTDQKRFEPARIEMILALLCFAGIILWMMLCKKNNSGNGDLLWTVLCLWGMIRALTETLRAEPLIRIGGFNPVQFFYLLIADIPMFLWTIHIRRTQKNIVFTVFEWIALVCCELILIFHSSSFLSTGSEIGNLAVNTGCIIIGMIIILLAGKDNRY